MFGCDNEICTVLDLCLVNRESFQLVFNWESFIPKIITTLNPKTCTLKEKKKVIILSIETFYNFGEYIYSFMDLTTNLCVHVCV